MISSVFSFKPADTLFFRGAEPMVMGESHSSNFNFPPPVYTIEGAIRTLFYFRDKDKYKDFIKIGENKGGFNVFGPMFLAEGRVYVPAPYSWYKESSKGKSTSHLERRITKFTEVDKSVKETKIIKSFELSKDIDFIKTKSNNIYWAKPENDELISLGGNWLDFNDLINFSEKAKIFSTSAFFKTEAHTGIALKQNRTVKESHIYSFTHSRLLEDVEILFAVDKDIPLEEEEILTLGAEQRFGLLRKLKNENFNSFVLKMKGSAENGGGYASLSIIKGSGDLNKKVVATGKIQYIGGWDLKKGFHKDMAGYFPAGTVFQDKFCEGLMPI